MKVAIIGAGNMGGAIARGLAQGTIIPASDVTAVSYTHLDVYKRQPFFCLLGLKRNGFYGSAD